MRFYRSRLILVLLLSAALIIGGIHVTNYNMKAMTLWTGEGPFVFRSSPDGLEVRLLGVNMDRQAEGVMDIFSGIVPFLEIKAQTIKEYLRNVLNNRG